MICDDFGLRICTQAQDRDRNNRNNLNKLSKSRFFIMTDAEILFTHAAIEMLKNILIDGKEKL